MSTNNIFKTGSLDQRERHTFSIDDFGGVDYSSNPLMIADSRAVDMKNILKKESVNQKRKGWKQIAPEYDLAIPVGKIIGFWTIPTQYGDYYVVQCGGNFYFISFLNGNIHSYEKIVFAKDTYFINEETQGFVTEDNLYLLTGVYFARLKLSFSDGLMNYEFKPVSDFEDVYIPTVTLNIRPYRVFYKTFPPYGDWETNVNIDTGFDIVRSSFEDVNLLTPMIKVEFRLLDLPTSLSDSINSGDKQKPNVFCYTLPLGVKIDSVIATKVSLDGLNNSLLSQTYLQLSNGTKYALSVIAYPKSGDITTENSIVQVTEENQNTFDERYVLEYGFFIDSNCTLILSVTINESDLSVRLVGNNVYNNALLEGTTILCYPHFTEGNSDKIHKCTLGQVYKDRLFLSGNSDCPNCDWHSGGDDLNYSYFSDLDYCYYGLKTNPIKGYTILSTGQLCVLKQVSKHDSTIYFRTGEFITTTDFSGATKTDASGNTLSELAFPLETGNIGEGLINTKSLRMFDNDTIFLSKNGLFSIVSNNTNSDVKYAYLRSKLINKKLLQYDLSQAVTYQWKDWLLIAIPNAGIVFVADKKYKSVIEGDTSDYQYEWWILENIFASCFFEIGDELYFGNERGEFFSFSEEYQDISLWNSQDDDNGWKDILYSEKSEVYDQCSALIGWSKEDLQNIRWLEFSDPNGNLRLLHCFADETNLSVQTINNTEKNFLEWAFDYESEGVTKPEIRDSSIIENYLNEFMNSYFQDGNEVYVQVSGESTYIKAYIRSAESNGTSSGGNRFRLVTEPNGNTDISLSSTKIKLYKVKSNLINIEFDFDESGLCTGKYKVIGDFGLYEGITAIDNISDSIVGRFWKQDAVESYYLTKPFSLGTTVYTKNIYYISLTNNLIGDSRTDFGIRFKDSLISNVFSYQNQEGLDFSRFSFMDIHFAGNTYAKSMGVSYKVRRVNFIQFLFSNKENSNMSVNSLSVLYTYGFKMRGEI